MLPYIIKQAIFILVEIIDIAILGRILISYIDSLRYSKIANILYQLTEPILYPCRMLLDRLGFGGGMFDFSPILAYLLLKVITTLVFTIL